MKAESGTYALILQSCAKTRIQIGRWRAIEVKTGYYLYIGSAFGPGGVRARVSRHLRREKTCRWHVDYLGKVTTPVGAWYSHDSRRLEHRWAKSLRDMKGMNAVAGFGCTDCECYSHLFHTASLPDQAVFSDILGVTIESWPDSFGG